MSVRCLAIALTIGLTAPRPAHAQRDTDPTHLIVARDSVQYLLSVPVSHLMMRVPKGSLHFVPQRGGASPRYFLFADAARGLQISGWFEPADGFKDIQTMWKGETDSWKQQHIPEPINVSFAKFGKWDGVLYDVAVPTGHDVNIRASWVEAGTWIDIHLSMTGTASSSALRAQLRAVLDGIVVSEKPPQ